MRYKKELTTGNAVKVFEQKVSNNSQLNKERVLYVHASYTGFL